MPTSVFSSISYQLYTVHVPKHWLVRDEPVSKYYPSTTEDFPHQNMLFHVSAGDYITTLATILRFFEETIHDKKITPEMRTLQLETIRNVMNDLLYLDKNYTIIPKEKLYMDSHNEKTTQET
jgi:hypothetical protein